jgi:S-DNA-T family DNA segregation ATPase FtsK/SpoIIIE
MATQKNSRKETIQKEKKGIKWIQNIRATIKNETVQFITGLLLLMVGAYMILAFSSFILNGGTDQSAMEQQGSTELAVSVNTKEVQNATGERGAHIAHSLVNHGFGIPAYSIAFFLIVLGLTFMRIRRFDLKHWAICCAIKNVLLVLHNKEEP